METSTWGSDTIEDTEQNTTPESVSSDIQIRRSGTSLTVNVTKLCRILGVDQGDVVSVTLRKK